MIILVLEIPKISVASMATGKVCNVHACAVMGAAGAINVPC